MAGRSNVIVTVPAWSAARPGSLIATSHTGPAIRSGRRRRGGVARRSPAGRVGSASSVGRRWARRAPRRVGLVRVGGSSGRSGGGVGSAGRGCGPTGRRRRVGAADGWVAGCRTVAGSPCRPRAGGAATGSAGAACSRAADLRVVAAAGRRRRPRPRPRRGRGAGQRLDPAPPRSPPTLGQQLAAGADRAAGRRSATPPPRYAAAAAPRMIGASRARSSPLTSTSSR